MIDNCFIAVIICSQVNLDHPTQPSVSKCIKNERLLVTLALHISVSVSVTSVTIPQRPSGSF